MNGDSRYTKPFSCLFTNCSSAEQNKPMKHEPVILRGDEKTAAAWIISSMHYAHSVPSGKSHYVKFGSAYVVWSIPANNNLAKFILGQPGKVWELSRLWAPDGHEPNLLTEAISAAVGVIQRLERPDALVSYADTLQGHHGGVYRAASWLYHGRTEDCRGWKHNVTGQWVARRKFHSGKTFLRKPQIEALGYTQCDKVGKERFVKPLSRQAKRHVKSVTLDTLVSSVVSQNSPTST
jgi:hypothetical protein